MTDKPPQRAHALAQSNFNAHFPFFRLPERAFKLLSSPPPLQPPYPHRSPLTLRKSDFSLTALHSFKPLLLHTHPLRPLCLLTRPPFCPPPPRPCLLKSHSAITNAF